MASSKKAKKYGDINVPAQSLMPPDKDGWLIKQGGSIKTWKKRYFVLKGTSLYYYKTPKDTVFTGKIELEPTSLVREEPGKKKANLFTISTSKRVFPMHPEKPEELKDWIDAITKSIENAKSSGGAAPSNSGDRVATAHESTEPKKTTSPGAKTQLPAGSPRSRLAAAKNEVDFLKDEDSKVLEFWQIWSESIPSPEDLTTSGPTIDYYVAASADMQKLTWRTNGPQNIFIQKMVDFFWNVGAPESEIDRLNDVGALINPVKIGSWIDMSGKGGMDGGWYFPVDIPLKLAVESGDQGESIKTFAEWAEGNGVTSVFGVGRDMGAAPPRQTELRLKVPGADFDAQLQTALGAFEAFKLPPLSDAAVKIMRDSKASAPANEPISLSVITSSEGFVRLGVLVPKPSKEVVTQLCNLVGGNRDNLSHFESALGGEGPIWAEYQFLQKGFGYGVYKEGFDIVFHYLVGQDEHTE